MKSTYCTPGLLHTYSNQVRGYIQTLNPTDYKLKNKLNTSVAYCDTTAMENSKPTAPVYFNKKPEGVRWLSINQNWLVFAKLESDSPNLSFYKCL